MFFISLLFLFSTLGSDTLFCSTGRNKLKMSLFYCIDKSRLKTLNKYLLNFISILKLEKSITNFVKNEIIVFELLK